MKRRIVFESDVIADRLEAAAAAARAGDCADAKRRLAQVPATLPDPDWIAWRRRVAKLVGRCTRS